MSRTGYPQLQGRMKALCALILLAITLIASQLATTAQFGATLSVKAATGVTHYVSKAGSNADGKSWATAWNELNKINWSVVQPGDTVLLDGGAAEMIYTTSLVVPKSGTSTAPITIKLASETGRNGKAVIFGGRSIPLPYCDQTSYTYQTSGVRMIGIDLGARAWIVVDGTKWRGITVYGHNQYGVSLSSGSNNITVRNVELYDNGSASQSNGTWEANQEGVRLSGTNVTFERAIVHDNGQDAFQSGGGVANFTLRESWLYNERPHPTDAGFAFNHCRHPDGIQIYGGGVQSGVTVDRSVLGPGFNQGVILGQSPSNGQTATINNVTLRNSLFINATGNNILGYPNVKEQNWRIENVTSFMTPRNPSGDSHNALFLEGTGHVVTNSIFHSGNVYLPDRLASSQGNCQWATTGHTSYVAGQTSDPQFISNVAGLGNTPSMATLINTNFALQPGSPCAGKGSSITSVAQLLGQPPTAQPSPTPAPNPTAAPSPTPAPNPTAVPSPTAPIALEAEQGALTNPFTVNNGIIAQSIETIDPAKGGKAQYQFSVPAGSYVVKLVLDAPSSAANSLFINIDGEPTNPTMITDLPTTVGVQERVASWRGTGTVDANQYTPKVFTLAAGTHQLIIRGREANVRIDRIVIQPYAPATSLANPRFMPWITVS